MLTYQEKASFLDGNQSSKHLANLKSGEITPLPKGGFTQLLKIGETLCSSRIEDLLGVTTRGNKDFIEVTTRGRIEFLESIKKGSQLATLGNVDIKYRASENYGIEFARKIKNSDVVFIELPIEGKGMQQFKFKTSGLKWKVE